jgi:hypothetical protein
MPRARPSRRLLLSCDLKGRAASRRYRRAEQSQRRVEADGCLALEPAFPPQQHSSSGEAGNHKHHKCWELPSQGSTLNAGHRDGSGRGLARRYSRVRLWSRRRNDDRGSHARCSGRLPRFAARERFRRRCFWNGIDGAAILIHIHGIQGLAAAVDTLCRWNIPLREVRHLRRSGTRSAGGATRGRRHQRAQTDEYNCTHRQA